MAFYILIVNQEVHLIRFADMLANLNEQEFSKPTLSVGKGCHIN